jgi:hypothetical protein
MKGDFYQTAGAAFLVGVLVPGGLVFGAMVGAGVGVAVAVLTTPATPGCGTPQAAFIIGCIGFGSWTGLLVGSGLSAWLIKRSRDDGQTRGNLGLPDDECSPAWEDKRGRYFSADKGIKHP